MRCVSVTYLLFPLRKLILFFPIQPKSPASSILPNDEMTTIQTSEKEETTLPTLTIKGVDSLNTTSSNSTVSPTNVTSTQASSNSTAPTTTALTTSTSTDPDIDFLVSQWTLGYTKLSALGVDDMSPKSMYKSYLRMKQDRQNSGFKLYHRQTWILHDPTNRMDCNETCHAIFMCAMVHFTK